MVIAITALDSQARTNEPFLRIMAPFEIDSVLPNSPAADIEMQRGDRIVKVNEKQIRSLPDLQEAFRNEPNDHTLIEIQRLENGDTTILVREVRIDPQKRIGVFTRESIQYTAKSNSFFGALLVGVRNTFSSLTGHVNASFMIPETKSSKRGPIAISSVFGVFSWLPFWSITAAWSTGLIIWNLLPYPKSALWESVALAYERVSRKKYTRSFFNKTLSLGWIIIIGRILWVIVNDVAKLF